MRRFPRLLDIAVILFISALTFIFALRVYGPGGEQRKSATLSLRGENGVWVYPLEKEETVEISGPLGKTRIGISGGKARFISSPCANQTCVACAPIGRRGQWIACLPNAVFAAVETGSADIDAAVW